MYILDYRGHFFGSSEVDLYSGTSPGNIPYRQLTGPRGRPIAFDPRAVAQPTIAHPSVVSWPAWFLPWPFTSSLFLSFRQHNLHRLLRLFNKRPGPFISQRTGISTAKNNYLLLSSKKR